MSDEASELATVRQWLKNCRDSQVNVTRKLLEAERERGDYKRDLEALRDEVRRAVPALREELIRTFPGVVPLGEEFPDPIDWPAMARALREEKP